MNVISLEDIKSAWRTLQDMKSPPWRKLLHGRALSLLRLDAYQW